MHRTAIEATCKASAARIINVLEAGASPRVVGEVAVIGGVATIVGAQEAEVGEGSRGRTCVPGVEFLQHRD